VKCTRLPFTKFRRSAVLLTQIVVVLMVVGVCLWLINNLIPMAGTIKAILAVRLRRAGFHARNTDGIADPQTKFNL
jgi:hypothetical protein